VVWGGRGGGPSSRGRRGRSREEYQPAWPGASRPGGAGPDRITLLTRARLKPPRDEPISIRRARVHNLQGVDCDIPRTRLVVITGPSGSGKSSLAFDTLYAEGQRRYVESL